LLIFLFYITDDYDYQHLNETYYDAFVLYAREDQEFVNQIVAKMEGEYGLKVKIKIFFVCNFLHESLFYFSFLCCSCALKIGT
jgi:hypothetical protein